MAGKLAGKIEGARFLGRDSHGGICGRCDRDLTGGTYLIDIDGDETVMGRRCAARTMGWATSRVEMMAIQAERYAELTRRRGIIGAAYPALADATERCNSGDMGDLDWDGSNALFAARGVYYEASNADYFWDETHPAYGQRGTWQEYVEANI